VLSDEARRHPIPSRKGIGAFDQKPVRPGARKYHVLPADAGPDSYSASPTYVLAICAFLGVGFVAHRRKRAS
jgi:hypothetical protein